jgi:hypothetical protein
MSTQLLNSWEIEVCWKGVGTVKEHIKAPETYNYLADKATNKV